MESFKILNLINKIQNKIKKRVINGKIINNNITRVLSKKKIVQ